ncbi:MAG TPA: tetratricopeptide repeat protein [Bdellovibrionales bacterium]|nr:tetratricopeptide repeat protein [Bdellovibrionales bacterium]
MAKSICRACKTNEVPPHLEDRGLSLCFVCQSDKQALSRVLQPQSHVRAFFDKCAICGDAATADTRTFCLCPNCLKAVEVATQKSPVQLEQNLHRPWMVKSANRIWGPMSTEEVERGLRAKEVSALDEVTKPFQHWRYIREEPDFKPLLDELKMNAHAREDTLSITLIENTASSVAEAIRDVKPLSVDEELGPIKHYDFDSPDATPVKSSRARVYAAFAALAVAALVVIGVFQWGAERSLPESDAQIDAVVREILFSKNQADKERALGILREAYERRPKHPRLALNLALLHVEQKQTIPATRILEALMKSDLPAAHQIEVRNALALAFIMNGQLARAREELEAVQKNDPENFVAAFNMSALHLLDGDYAKARELALKALELKPNSGEALTLEAEIALKDFEKNKDRAWLESSLKRLREFAATAIDRKQEATIFAALLAHRLGQSDDASRFMEGFVEIDPELSHDHLHDLMTFKEHLFWEQILAKCRELSSQLNATPRLSSALGLCHLKANEPLVGREVIEDSLRRAPDDHVVQAMYGYVQSLVGQKDQAEASYKRAASGPDLPVAFILRGRSCLASEDWDCATLAFNKALDRNSDTIQAHVGLAQIAIENRDRERAQRLLAQAEKLSPHYIPLLRLREILVMKGML